MYGCSAISDRMGHGNGSETWSSLMHGDVQKCQEIPLIPDFHQVPKVLPDILGSTGASAQQAVHKVRLDIIQSIPMHFITLTPRPLILS